MTDYGHLFRTMPFDEAADLAVKIAKTRVNAAISWELIRWYNKDIDFSSSIYTEFNPMPSNFVPWFCTEESGEFPDWSVISKLKFLMPPLDGSIYLSGTV